MGSRIRNSEKRQRLHFAWRIPRSWKLVCCSISESDSANAYRNGEPNPDLTASILKNCADLAPEILDDRKNFKFISQQVGLRPSRSGGVRVEAERLRAEEVGDVDVVHCYGHGGDG